MHSYTRQDILDVLYYEIGRADDGPFDATAANRASYEQGKDLAEETILVQGQRFVRSTVLAQEPDITDLDSPAIRVSAGHIATSEAERWIGLRKR